MSCGAGNRSSGWIENKGKPEITQLNQRIKVLEEQVALLLKAHPRINSLSSNGKSADFESVN